MSKETDTDYFIRDLLNEAKLNFTSQGSDIKEVDDALDSASKNISTDNDENNRGYPEFVAKSSDFLIIIEDKADRNKQVKYLGEGTSLDMGQEAIKNYAENGALHYAQCIINHEKNYSFKKIFAFGCSGDEKHHIIKPIFVDENQYILLPEVENFENFNDKNIDNYYKEQVLGETPKEILELEEILKKAEELHEYLRDYGNLRETENPLVVSAILLALNQEINIGDRLKGGESPTDGEILYRAVEDHLRTIKVQPETKKEVILNEFNLLKTRVQLNEKDLPIKDENGNEIKDTKDNKLYMTPLKFFTNFIYENIYHTAKHNAQEDILAKFYGEFIRYSGGDGQSLGIVLTPTHITNLFCELVDLQPDDIVFDPCCGTGSFLLSAMRTMIEKSDSSEQISKIKKEQIHGIESREDMFSIATTNMILRGDGKSNLLRDNFLNKNPSELQEKNFSVGFMNPPYSQSKNKDTWHLSEISFVEHLLNSLKKQARAVVIVPLSAMVGKNKYDRDIKENILKNHTLEGVITLNPETFYGVGTHPCIAIFKCHVPHPSEKNVKFINFKDDGFKVAPHIGLIETERAIERKTHLLDCWLHDKEASNEFMVKTKIKHTDEWLHSFYYFNDEIPSEEIFTETISEYLSFEFNMVMKSKENLFN